MDEAAPAKGEWLVRAATVRLRLGASGTDGPWGWQNPRQEACTGHSSSSGPHDALSLKLGARPDWGGSVGWVSHKVKGHRFDSQSGHMPGLWLQSLIRV